jgi:hypothetical protein
MTVPATGLSVSMGRVFRSFTNVPEGTGSATNIRLSGTLGSIFLGRTPGTTIQFSSAFGGRTTPYFPYGSGSVLTMTFGGRTRML